MQTLLFNENSYLEITIARADDAEIAYLVEVDSKNPESEKHNSKFSPSRPESKAVYLSSFTGLLKCFMTCNFKSLQMN